MSLTDIVGTTPEPWWPEGLSHIEEPDDDRCNFALDCEFGEQHIDDYYARLMFIGSCMEWLLRYTPVMIAADAAEATIRTIGGARNDGPDILAALVAACRSVKQ